jgi:hypothetical protein
VSAIGEDTGRTIIGIPVWTDVKIVEPPDRYMDDRGVEMWDKVMALLASVEQRAAA